jgi:hypothetical protein
LDSRVQLLASFFRVRRLVIAFASLRRAPIRPESTVGTREVGVRR